MKATYVLQTLFWCNLHRFNQLLTNNHDAVVEVDEKIVVKVPCHLLGEKGPNTHVGVVSRQLEYFCRLIAPTDNQHAFSP